MSLTVLGGNLVSSARHNGTEVVAATLLMTRRQSLYYTLVGGTHAKKRKNSQYPKYLASLYCRVRMDPFGDNIFRV